MFKSNQKPVFSIESVMTEDNRDTVVHQFIHDSIVEAEKSKVLAKFQEFAQALDERVATAMAKHIADVVSVTQILEGPYDWEGVEVRGYGVVKALHYRVILRFAASDGIAIEPATMEYMLLIKPEGYTIDGAGSKFEIVDTCAIH